MAGEKLTLIHLSDIHFIRGFSGESKFDLDAPVRDALIEDAVHLKDRLKPIGGVLVTGDIAFAGKTSEFETAKTWLSRLSGALDCDPGYVWCVPGNHDVDRSFHKEFSAIPALHEQLRKTTDLDKKLRDHCENENTGPMLFAPFRAYNEVIGQRFDCLTQPKQPWWTDDLPLNDGSILRLRGLNSALVSGVADDEPDRKNRLLLGSAQTEYGHQRGVEYLTLCHHPIDWLQDGDNAEKALLAYSRIQLFGHKHVQSVVQKDNSLWLTAGAVHPLREEKQWEPRYNCLSIWVEGTDANRKLCVELYARVWSHSERLFTREQSSADSDHRLYKLTLRAWKPEMPRPLQSESDATKQVRAAESGDSRLSFHRKKLLYRFVELPHHKRLAIIEKFGLKEAGDDTRPDVELFAAFFDRAHKKGIIDQVWEAIEAEKG